MNSSTAQRAEARSGLLLVMLAAMLWGTTGITTKTLYGLSATTPLSVGFFRLALSAPILWFAGWQAVRGRLFQVPQRDLAVMALMGLMTAISQVCYFTAVKGLGVAVATLITICTAPVLVAVLAATLFKESLTRRIMLALLGALIGTGLLIQIEPNSLALNSAALSGTGWALGAALSYAIVVLAGRHLSGRYHPVQPIAIGFTVGALALLALGTAVGLVFTYPPVGWLLLLYLGAVPTALGYVLFQKGVRHVPATVASVATLMEPLTATVLAVLIFHESLSLSGLLGAGLLCASLFVLWRR